MIRSITAPDSLTWVIGGAQGSGVDSAANIFSRACSQGGFYIFGNREYYSNIKGEHSYFTVTVSNRQVRSHLDNIDMLVSFDAETVFRHGDKLRKGGAIIYDADIVNTTIEEVPSIDDHAVRRISTMLAGTGKPLTVQGMLDYAKDNGSILYKIPYFQLLKEFSEKISDHSLSKLTRMINVMALAASMAILNFDNEILSKAIRYVFRAKPKIAELNIANANYSYNYIKSNFASTDFKVKLTCSPPSPDIILVQGNQSSAMGKITAGCRFQTYYPITPASDDSEFLESNQIIEQIHNDKKGSIVVVQTEDEIAAITMAIGGALTGVRSATATSGPGFSLMAEALGWAGINEVPVVISLYQRAGPSTGLPTRHEQGDLLFAINCGHGEFPKIVFASGDIEESFYDTIKAFNFAEKYQLPVIHLLDKAIANSIMTCKVFDQQRTNIDRGGLIENVVPTSSNTGVARNYLRFKLDENPISPRVRLGTENAVFWNTGDEHTEEGHITEDPENRIKMMNKRMSKMDLAIQEIPDEDKAASYGQEDLSSGITIVSWGSTKGAILDALDRLAEEEQKKIKFIQVRLMHPFPTILLEKMLENTKVLIDIEMNYTGQIGLLIKQNLNRNIDYKIVKYNGRPISSSEVYNALMCIINGNAPRRIVLEHGT
jgi:2-oxoglutarate ferredoxin oxidoreductase subunit alpha